MPGGYHLGLWQRESTDFRKERDAGRAEESGGEGDPGGRPVTMYVLCRFLLGYTDWQMLVGGGECEEARIPMSPDS